MQFMVLHKCIVYNHVSVKWILRAITSSHKNYVEIVCGKKNIIHVVMIVCIMTYYDAVHQELG